MLDRGSERTFKANERVFCRTLRKKGLFRALGAKKYLTFGLKYALIKALLMGKRKQADYLLKVVRRIVFVFLQRAVFVSF